MKLRYGMNPHQAAMDIEPVSPGQWPVRLLNGEPSFINLLDALNAWQLVRQASQVLGLPAAASFKHVSPAGAAVAGAIDDVIRALYDVSEDASAVTAAYLRARDADPKSSYGDFAAVSQPVDDDLADVLTRVVCDGIVAPGFAPGTVERLSAKKNGRFVILQTDESFEPPHQSTREVFGLRLTQHVDDATLSPDVLRDVVGEPLPQAAVSDLLLGLVVLRFTQSNSVCYVRNGTTLGIGAGQQSRVDCTRLAGAKVDTWWLRRHPAVRALAFQPDIRRQERINWQIRFIEGDLTSDEMQRLAAALREPTDALTSDQRIQWMQGLTDVGFVSDGALPFRDNVDHAARHGVRYIAEPGGSTRSDEIAAACRAHGITLARTGLRLFHH